ncbi:MAG: DUF4159 domain-containing protein [Planctomycetaceae bacterium]
MSRILRSPWLMLLAIVSGFVLYNSGLGIGQEGRKLGTCGPPPRKNPQRQTSAEGFPPLPLPVTPLRRSEPKAEPAPPLMIAKLEYGTTQDWNTDPGDVDNLMRHCRYELGLWYGWKPLSLNEVVSLYQAQKKCEIPILYISGHEVFEFTDEQREALKQYILDGGTLLGDACCGREEFAASFRNEIRQMFPDRSFDRLEVDHPIFRAYHNYTTVNFRTFEGGVQHDFQGPPELMGMNIGCRTAVIFSPWDMSCGWDEHTHPHGLRLLPGDALRLGINIISYVAAVRQLGEVQAVTMEIQGVPERPRQQFQLAQLRHQGDWNPDPNSCNQWLRHLALDAGISVDFNLHPVDAQENRIANFPFLYLTGHREPQFSDTEIEALRVHLQSGGFLFVNNCCGRSSFDQHVRQVLSRIFPDQELSEVPAEHPLYKSYYDITEVRDRQSNSVRTLDLEGLKIKDRYVVVYSRHDAISHLKQVSDPYGDGFDAESCRRLAINIVAYALQN